MYGNPISICINALIIIISIQCKKPCIVCIMVVLFLQLVFVIINLLNPHHISSIHSTFCTNAHFVCNVWQMRRIYSRLQRVIV